MESFAVDRTGAGVDALIARLLALSPALVAVEATGGFETIVAAGLAGASLPLLPPSQSEKAYSAAAAGGDR